MLTLHLLGHTYLSQDGTPVSASAKAVALMCYLTLQRRPLHREQLAELLWDTPDALRNLRVELNRIRHLGLDLFPARQPLLELALPTDLDRWTQAADHLTDVALPGWLSVACGLPLSGLEDLGALGFHEWVDRQRWAIGQQVEQTLDRVYVRALQTGRLAAAAQLRAQAEELGMVVQAVAPAASRAESPVQFERPSLVAQVREVLARARYEPQLLVLDGQDSDSKRELVRQATAQSEWTALHVQSLEQSELQQRVFLHHLLRLLPPETQRQAQVLLTQPGDPVDHLMQLWTLVALAGQALVIVIHDLHTLTAFLKVSMHYLMGLPGKLVLVLAPASAEGQRSLRDGLSRLDRSRIHHLTLRPLSVQEVMSALERGRMHLNPEQRRASATRIVQWADGWDAHVQALIGAEGAAPGQRPRLPPGIADALIGDLGTGQPEVRTALARLSLVYGPLRAEVARQVLGDQAEEVLLQGAQLGLLVTAAPEETVWLPGLIYRSSDQEDALCFVSDALRVALAASLSSFERRSLRARLAEFYSASDPDLSRMYRSRAGLDGPGPELVSGVLQGSGALAGQVVTSGDAQRMVGQLRLPSGSALVRAEGRQETRTDNGYRVLLDAGELVILRRGTYGRPPLLRLIWPDVSAGPWSMVARLDTLHTAPELAGGHTGHALGLRVGSGPRRLYGVEGHRPPAPQEQLGGALPVGQWFVLHGLGGAGHLELSVRAVDVALTLAAWRWSGQVMLD